MMAAAEDDIKSPEGGMGDGEEGMGDGESGLAEATEESPSGEDMEDVQAELDLLEDAISGLNLTQDIEELILSSETMSLLSNSSNSSDLGDMENLDGIDNLDEFGGEGEDEKNPSNSTSNNMEDEDEKNPSNSTSNNMEDEEGEGEDEEGERISEGASVEELEPEGNNNDEIGEDSNVDEEEFDENDDVEEYEYVEEIEDVEEYEDVEEEFEELKEALTPAPYKPPTSQDPFADGGDASDTAKIGDEWEDWPQESPEEMMHDKNVETVVGAVFVSVFLFMVIVSVCIAHQMIENPDGCCASMCRCCVNICCGLAKVVCFPCCMCFGGKGTHDHLSSGDGYSHDLELS